MVCNETPGNQIFHIGDIYCNIRESIEFNMKQIYFMQLDDNRFELFVGIPWNLDDSQIVSISLHQSSISLIGNHPKHCWSQVAQHQSSTCE